MQKIAPMLQKPEGKKGGEKPNRSWNAPLVCSGIHAWICLRFNAHNIW
jgi:hypothetical protein